MRTFDRKIERARAAIAALRSIIASGRIPCAERPWRGAHVVITAQPQPEPVQGSIESFCGSDRGVVTEHVLELSWVFERLWSGFSGMFDGCTKLEFFGRLQLAASRALSGSAGLSSAELCDAVIDEAAVMLAEISIGTFDYLVVAPGRAIKADFAASRN